MSIEDVQNHPDSRNIAINKVGIKDIRHPFKFIDKEGQQQATVGTFNMAVNLAHHQKGTHMSRFVALLNEDCQQFSIKGFPTLLEKMTHKLEADTGYITMEFLYFVNKSAPISGVKSLLDYQIKLEGQWSKSEAKVNITVVIPVTSLCPCSKKISEYGAHNQRSHITVNAAIKNDICAEDIIRLVEKQASSELYSLLKRPDEKYVTELAYDNPKFVEDVVRDVANSLNNDSRILAYTLEAENFESIHNHSAYAVIENNKLT
ncbi:MAG: GTP cyclohydrolase I FolE2 [Cycloclasticus sp.]|jgi:GTP cyclohydrolase I|nr:MAG: GTP cyclohydrolase FolE2 [Cycloclasticus sp. Phe_18]MBV1912205.1 GTP cyclohydrolase I FolE2 [Cycloclasticus sp.]MDF1688198.1 GTP cyclohydrolase FolE2 [Cycloclasticus sp.]